MCIFKVFEDVWTFFCPSKPYVSLSIEGNIQEYEKTQATIRLMNELAKGRHSGEAEDWLTQGNMWAHFRERANEE